MDIDLFLRNQDLAPCLLQAVGWGEMETRVQKQAEEMGTGSATAWQKLVLRTHAERHVAFNPACSGDFYKDLLREMRTNLHVYPYHLANSVQVVDFPDPFEYYTELLCDALRTGKFYEEIPKLTAADVLQVVGIQINAYSDILAQCRAKGAAGRISKLIRALLPSYPLTVQIEDWWEVYPLARVSNSRGTATEEELRTLQEVCDCSQSGQCAVVGLWEKRNLEGLYAMGVIGFHIAISSSQAFLQPPDLIQSFQAKSDMSYFERSVAIVLRTLRDHDNVEDIMQDTGLSREIVSDALALLCRLHFTGLRESEGEKTLGTSLEESSHELLFSSLTFVVSVGVAVLGLSESEKRTFTSSEICATVQSTHSEISTFRSLLEDLSQEAPTSVLLTSSVSHRVHLTLTRASESYTSELKANDSLFQLFKLKSEGTHAFFFPVGKVVTSLPQALEDVDWFWMIIGEESPMLLEFWETLGTLREALPYQEVVLVPYNETRVCPISPNESSQCLTVPLPLDLTDCGNSLLKGFLTALNQKERLDACIGYLEIAYSQCDSNQEDVWRREPCCQQRFSLLSQRSGFPLAHPTLIESIIANLRTSGFLARVGLQHCAELQQVAVFRFQESLCSDKDSC